METIDKMENILREKFNVIHLEIIDDSRRHAGHAQNVSGGGHFGIRLISSDFVGKTPAARHRMIYAALRELIPAEIHALAIKADAGKE